jgi:aromatic ring-opening dioxygenase LigB subunit
VSARNCAPRGVIGCHEGYDGSQEAATEETEVVDERQQQQVNEAAEKFASAIKDSYQAIADRSVSAQELNAQLTQEFFNGVINNLRTQAENNRALAEDLIEQQRKQQEASQALTQESVNAYMDFLNSMFSYYRGSLDEAQRSARQ